MRKWVCAGLLLLVALLPSAAQQTKSSLNTEVGTNFPDNTTAHWRWPPFAPRNGPGVWSYQAVMHGNYDGGETETPIPPRRVHDVQAYSQDFAWTIDEAHGQANVLTEFYLRSSPTDSESKLLEVGWLLHTPEHSRKYFEAARMVGTYTDPQGRNFSKVVRWRGHLLVSTFRSTDDPSSPLALKGDIVTQRWLDDRGDMRQLTTYDGVSFSRHFQRDSR
jgi:hypothetical protein